MRKWRMKLPTRRRLEMEILLAKEFPEKIYFQQEQTLYTDELSRSISDTSPEKQYLVVYLCLFSCLSIFNNLRWQLLDAFLELGISLVYLLKVFICEHNIFYLLFYNYVWRYNILIMIHISTQMHLCESYILKSYFQKQPPEVFCKKGCSKKFRKIHRKTPVSESLCQKIDSGTGVFSVNFAKFLRTRFLRNTPNAPVFLQIVFCSRSL